jgi:hypothetical protein
MNRYRMANAILFVAFLLSTNQGYGQVVRPEPVPPPRPLPGPLPVPLPGPLPLPRPNPLPSPLPTGPRPLPPNPPPPRPPSPPPSQRVDSPSVIAVCTSTGNLSEDCLNSGLLEASRTLGNAFVAQYESQIIISALTLHFPEAMERTRQIRFLQRVEERAIRTVVAVMKRDVAKLTPFKWDTERERQQKEAVVRDTAQQVKQWEQDASSNASKGTNWSHDWSSNSHTLERHNFQLGPAFSQLQHISTHGW